MDLVDEEDGILSRFQLLDDLLEPLFEVAPVARAGDQRAHVEGEEGFFRQRLGTLALLYGEREPFDDRRLADARIAYQQRIVLRPPCENLQGACRLVTASDEGIDLSLLGFLVEVAAEDRQRRRTRAPSLLRLVFFVRIETLALRLCHAFRKPRHFGNAVADIVDRIEACHVLSLQEVGGVALAFRKDGDQKIRARHFVLVGRGLHMHSRALQDALKTRRRTRVLLRYQKVEIVVQIGLDFLPQLVQINAASAHHRRGIAVVDQRQQKMFQGRVFVPSLLRILQRAM